MTATLVLVINSGSSSIKYQLVDPVGGDAIASGLVERIGEPEGHIRHRVGERAVERRGRIADHTEGLRQVFDLFAETGQDLASAGVGAVGHRVVHGGEEFNAPTLIDDDVLAEIHRLRELAPLHMPANAAGIESARELLPDVPQVAVFDTAFFNGLPEAARTYAIDANVAREHGIRRYGFHGTSHEYVSGRVAEILGKDPSELNQIVLHLGNGASASVIRGGRAVDTTMGLTPLEGLVMGTRSGDIDPAIFGYLQRVADMDIDSVDDLLNRNSGIKGLCGINDFRELSELVERGDSAAKLAFDVYIHRLRRYIGAYMVELGEVHTITFTAGVGENAPMVRAAALAGLERYGISIDETRNNATSNVARVISPVASPVIVFVIPTNEELAIARAALRLIRTS
jgi:acetate kinase